MLQDCFNEVSNKCQLGFKGVLRWCQEGFKEVSRGFQESFRSISRRIQDFSVFDSLLRLKEVLCCMALTAATRAEGGIVFKGSPKFYLKGFSHGDPS